MAHATRYNGVEMWENKDVRTATTGEAIAKQRFCVKLSSATIIKTTGNTDVACGLAMDSYASGEQGEYIVRGRLRFIATGSIAVGDPLAPDNATPGNMEVATSGMLAFGRAIEAAETGEYCFGEFDFANPHLLA